jgi:hypothetical protein
MRVSSIPTFAIARLFDLRLEQVEHTVHIGAKELLQVRARHALEPSMISPSSSYCGGDSGGT